MCKERQTNFARGPLEPGQLEGDGRQLAGGGEKAAREHVATLAAREAEHLEGLARKYRSIEQVGRMLKGGSPEEEIQLQIYEGVRASDRRNERW